MCGFFGANCKIKYDNSLHHRGPDSSDSFEDNYITLHHNRLAIIDLTDEASQPFCYKNFVLVYNGEIYNYLEIKEELREYNFRTSSDTEVLLYSFDKWGYDCLNKFNGDFAFCIYDKNSKRLFCARDRVGNKPFYYYYNGKKFIFASEIKALKRYIYDFNVQKVGDAILFSINDNDEQTIYKNIYNLQPGHFLSFNLNNQKLSIKKWYHFKKRVINDFEKAIEEFDYLIKDAIKIRLRSDVEIVNMLSGGIDSSIIGYFLKDYKHYSVVFEEKDIDESNYIKLLEDKFNLKINYIKPSLPTNKDLLDLFETQEDIFRSLSIYAEYYLMKNVKEKVILNGQGANEIFGGYYHHIARFLLKKKNFIERIKLYKSQALEEIKIGLKFSLPKDLKRNILIEDNKRNLAYLQELLNNYSPNWELILKKFDKNINRALKNEIFSLNLPKELRQQDKNAMRFSIENRTPFTDYRIIEFGLNLPMEFKFNKGLSKFFLREFAKRILPKEIVFRLDKKGFEVPEKKWLENFNILSLFHFRIFQFFHLKKIFID